MTDTVIKVLAHDSGYSRLIPRGRAAGTAAAPAPVSEPVTPAAEPDTPLDAKGTRIAPRIQLQPSAKLQLGGAPVAIVRVVPEGERTDWGPCKALLTYQNGVHPPWIRRTSRTVGSTLTSALPDS